MLLILIVHPLGRKESSEYCDKMKQNIFPSTSKRLNTQTKPKENKTDTPLQRILQEQYIVSHLVYGDHLWSMLSERHLYLLLHYPKITKWFIKLINHVEKISHNAMLD